MTEKLRKQIGSLVFIAGSIILMIVFTYVMDPRPAPATVESRHITSYSTERSGAKAIYLVLKKILPAVGRWERPLHLLPEPGRSYPCSLLIMGPEYPLPDDEIEALSAWVEKGGQLILAIDPEKKESHEDIPYGWEYLLGTHDFHLEPDPDETEDPGEENGFFITGNSVLSRGDFTILSGGPSRIKSGEKKYGNGRVIIISDSLVWSNERLRKSNNAELLVQAVMTWGNGRLYIDEYHHGFSQSRGMLRILPSFLGTYYGFLILQIMLAGFLFIAARIGRFGTLIPEPPLRRQDPVDRIRAIGTFLEAGQAAVFSARSIHQRLLKRLWNLRYGAVAERSAARIEKTLQDAAPGNITISEYSSVIRKMENTETLTDKDLIKAAELAGRIIEEYRHGST